MAQDSSRVDQTTRESALQKTTSSSRLGAYGATLAVVLLVSSAPAVTRLSLARELGALDLVLLRCSVAGLVFLPFLLAHWRQMPSKLLLVGLVLAFLHGWGMHLTAIAGLQFSPAAHASALGPGFLPVWVMLWRWLCCGTPPEPRQSLGLALIAWGALVLVGYSSFSVATGVLIGDLLFLSSSCLAAMYLVYVQHHAIDPMQATSLVAVYSGIVGGLLLWIWPAPSALWTATLSEVVIQAIFQGLGLGASAVLLASYATRRLGSQRFAIFFAAIPVLSLLMGRTIAGDGVSFHEAVAIALISLGILVATLLSAEGHISRLDQPPLDQSRHKGQA